MTRRTRVDQRRPDQKDPVVKMFNHGPHVIIDVLTCGLWIPVHLLLWICAPTMPINYGRSYPVASATANTTFVFGAPASYPQPSHPGQPQYGQPAYPHQPQAVPPPAAPPAWAIEEARERLPQDAPWSVVESVALEYVARKQLEQPGDSREF